MINSNPKRRVLLVGAGRRIQNNFLPALTCLENAFQVVGIVSKTHSTAIKVADRWLVPAIARLSDVDFSRVDVVVVSVPTAQNANVLRELQAPADNLDLVIDTPIAWNLKEHADITPLLSRFRRVIVTEDYMNFPRFSLVRDAVQQGLIGALVSMTLYNIGYLYHGLALIRSFTGFGPVLNSRRTPLSSSASVVTYELADKFSAHVVGPYRRHTAGGLLVQGTKGLITEFPVDRALAGQGKRSYVLSNVLTDGVLSGVALQGDDGEISIDLPDMVRMRAMDVHDKSDLNLERGCGLISVFRSFLDIGNLNKDYGADNAFYDSFVSRRAESGELPTDPFGTFDPPPVGYPHVWVSKRKTFLKRSSLRAADLLESEKTEVPAGSRVEGDTAIMYDGHVVLRSARLMAKPIEGGPWFIHPDDWRASVETATEAKARSD